MSVRGSVFGEQSWVTLHLPPPDILTFWRSWDDFSRMMTLLLEFSAQVMAPKNPAAPPPMTMRSYFILLVYVYC